MTFGKPHPEPYLKTIKTLGIPSKHLLAFEDSHPGLKSATTAGLPTILVNKNALDIHLSGATDMVNTMSEFSIVTN